MRYFSMILLSVASLVAENQYVREPFQDHQICRNLMEKNITLVTMRHGEGTHNVQEVVSSSLSDKHQLTELGIEQATASAQAMREILTPDYILVSPLYRTRQTAAIVAEVMGIDEDRIFVADDLRETEFGVMEGKDRSVWPSKFDEKQFLRTPFAEGMETTMAVFDRLHALLSHIGQDTKFEGKTILLVTHNWPCRQISMCLKGSYGEKIPTAGFTILLP